ncbi:MAG: Wzz/FepE/Etk N-terminal domain-containing protein [Sulfurovum sp.]|nr:Wzz/FepE/Etk N-terminal domain-containing protein [Sulfurovum sp.]
MQNNTQYIEEDKIDLRELFSVLKRRKKLLWGVTILLTILAVIYAFFIAKPVYEVKAMIEVGQIGAKPIDDIYNIQQKLSYEYQVNVKNKKIELPRVKTISVPKKSSNILSITIHGYSNEEAIKYIQTVITKIETQYKEKTDAYVNNKQELILLVQEDIKENTMSLIQMKKDLDTYSQKIILLKSEDAALAGIYALQIAQKQTELQNLKKYLSGLKKKEQALKLSLTPLMIKPTKIVGEIETLDYAIKPKQKAHSHRCFHYRINAFCLFGFLFGVYRWYEERRGVGE